VGWLFILGSGSNYEHASRHIVTLLEAVWRGKRSPIREFVGAPIYVIQTSDPGHWTNPQAFFETLSSYLSDAGIPFTKLDTYDKIWNTLWSDNPPTNIIIINTHGEGQPIPTQYGLIYDTSAGDFAPDYKTVAQNYYKDLAARVRDYNWLLIEPIGYTFFNAQQNGHCTCEKGAIGTAGLNSFLSVINVSTDCWGERQSASPTPVVHCCALKYLWRSSWGSISASAVRFFRLTSSLVPITNIWQIFHKRLMQVYVSGAIGLGVPDGARLFD